MIENITVDKANLVETLTSNRETHKADFEEAIEGYQQAAADLLNNLANDVLADANTSLYINVPKPEDHTGEYDDALSMLEWSQDTSVVLDYHTFRNFVLDEWDWKDRFVATSSLYNGR